MIKNTPVQSLYKCTVYSPVPENPGPNYPGPLINDLKGGYGSFKHGAIVKCPQEPKRQRLLLHQVIAPLGIRIARVEALWRSSG